jgi:membrane-bound metal-dependent hydrolase YbcI (DUF457 family)
MTVFDHAMVGICGTLASGVQRRHGWQVVALAGCMAVLPDADGLSILLGMNAYIAVHRVWGHSLLVAGLAAAIVSAAAYWADAPSKAQQWLARRWQTVAIRGSPAAPPRGPKELAIWVTVGVLAAYSHLLADVFFSVGKDLPKWGVPLFWPFSAAEWAWPLVPWGDVGVTLIFAAAMFAMLRWPAWVRTIAAGSLIAAAAYMVVRGQTLPVQ